MTLYSILPMSNVQPKSSWAPRTVILASLLLAIAAGASTGFAVTFLGQTSPAPQTLSFYLFARDLSFNASRTSGLSSDYIYSANIITVNKGDTLVIHFYNPTDQSHTFTVGAPYANDAVVSSQPTDQSPIHNATITITASQPGTFQYHCRFHSPQMMGYLIVEQ
jgi:plastocyanin